MGSRLAVVVTLTLLCAARPAAAQAAPISTDGTDPRTWDPALDALVAGAKNHRVLYEDDDIRVLSVTVQPGEVEVPHHHRWPSVIVYDHPVRSENRDARGNVLPRKTSAGNAEWPPVIRVPPEAAHSVRNLDTVPLHLIRIELKKPVAPPR